ncbi:MAG: helix-turn-helix transcriptional regulator [Natronospirillum sp.]|uniref:helix-turn-helix transcriptional regulator n=1 Tax=Natronospirillum sp. TaxID=2812955 RepID=UPI0025FECE0A|nr:helix-turn-helix transcriptional regulator [Natronospirillum sp.]MCH8551511.1 helix-turn-helix transcriptional regulator [Natronospirillum sp.]
MESTQHVIQNGTCREQIQTVVNLAPLADQILQNFRPRQVDFDDLEARDRDQIGINLRRCRLSLQLNQCNMASLLGVSHTQYRNFEEGRHHLRLQHTAHFMVNTGIPLHYLFLNSCYSPLFDHLELNTENLPLQSFVGRCNDTAFSGLVDLVAGHLDIALPVAPAINLHWPDAHLIARELGNYYGVIGEGLFQLRQIVNLSQDDLATLLGITGATLAAYERNRITESRSYAAYMSMRLWAATGINPLWITHGSAFYARRQLQHLRMNYLQSLLAGQPDSVVFQLQKALWRLPGQTFDNPIIPAQTA